MNDNESLMELYALAFCPLSSNTLLPDVNDLSPDDISPDLVLDEAAFITKLREVGFTKFQLYLERYRDAEPRVAPQEVGAAVTCFAAYLRRLQTLTGSLLRMTTQLAVQYGDCASTLQAYETDVRESNRRPTDADTFRDVFDLTPHTRWGVSSDPVITIKGIGESSTQEGPIGGGGGRVGFKETTRVLTGENQEAEGALKVSEIKRKKQRNPTGYQKFNLRDLGLGSTDDSFSGPISTSASSTVGRDSRTSSEGESSARDSIGHNESIADEVNRQEALNPFKPGSKNRSNSFVVFSFDKEREEIKDDMADPNWATQQRHVSRFCRIRNRVPTGHPSLMKKNSEELHQLMNELDSLSSVEEPLPTELLTPPIPCEEETAKNTVLNRRTSTALSPQETEGP